MQFLDLKNTLEQQYSVACMTWLEDLECLASSTLYQCWAPHLQIAYNPNQRFILLNFRPVGQEVLDHVVKLIEYLDISPCFVLVVTNQTKIAKWFQGLTNPVQVELVNYVLPHFLPIYPVTPQFNTQNTMCAHAWTGVHIWPNGETSPCCEYTGTITDHNNQAYNIKTHTIHEIMHSKYMNLVRNEFRQGQFPAGCQRCYDIEQSSGESKHQLTPYKLANIYSAINWESNQVDQSLGFIGGHLGNLCNLRCRICSPVFSSSIAAEELNEIDHNVKSHPTYQLLADNRWSRNSKNFWQLLRSQADQICNFEFLGGEPLLLKENLEFMQWLVDHGHSQRAIFEFVTNGTQYPEIFNQAHRFKRLTVTISIDNIGSKFEYERNGADWKIVSDNIKKFVACKQQNLSLHVGVCITVNIQNVLYLPELIAWLRTQGIDHYYFNVLVSPHYLSIDRLTKPAKELVLNRLRLSNLDAKDQTKLEYIINCVANATTSDGQLFCQMMQDKDQSRGESFILTHQEIAEAMGFVL
jgi:MoaA/NifB/PqqE/SkfB family radical SAM enzyme